jgi:hypothetical protein
MINNAQKKKAIDEILAKYSAKMAALKQKRNKVVSDFLETLKKKKIEEIRNSLKKL